MSTLPIVNENKEMVLREDAFSVVKKTLYPEAPDDQVKLYLEYCKVRQVDPFAKAYYLIERKDNQKGITKWEIQPGVGAYRIQAVRSSEYGGLSDVTYGPNKVFKLSNGGQFTYPEWAEVKVKRIVKGHVCEFSSGKIFWLEEYSRYKNGDPMKMWQQRPQGQIGKCAEAQALRKAFPDCVDQGATAEELEGKPLIETNFKPEIKVINPPPQVQSSVDAKISEQTLTKLHGMIAVLNAALKGNDKDHSAFVQQLKNWQIKANVMEWKEIKERTGEGIIKTLIRDYSHILDEITIAEDQNQRTQYDNVVNE